jgi:pyruvate dehydrogenase (quinone)/pyruvate oxidase
MGCSLPYAIAAQLAYPNRQSIAFVGDGGFSMLMADFVTCVKYQLPVKVVVIKNNSLGQIKWEQMVFLGNPEYGCDLQPIDFAAFARACGLLALPSMIRRRVGRRLRWHLRPWAGHCGGGRRPFEPPMPPKVSLDQVTKFAQSLAKGQPHRGKIALTVLSDKVRELI